MRTLPDLLSFTRILIAPAMLVAARFHAETAFVLLFAAGLLTDVLDGMLARRLGVASEAGSHLDSLADVPFCLALPIGLWWLSPDLLIQERVTALVILGAYATSVAAGLLRFGRLAALHTWAARLSGFLIGAGFVVALAGDPLLLRLAALARVVATAEELAILRVLPGWQPDVGSLHRLLRSGRRTIRAAATLPSRGDA